VTLVFFGRKKACGEAQAKEVEKVAESRGDECVHFEVAEEAY
jgi:hypothetical protein